ncbi:MAG: S41 family peptidase [Treponemataceae bacterium]
MKNVTSKFIIALLAGVFAFYSIFAPNLFAQAKKNKSDTVKVSQYMQLINSVYGFILQNYVDEVDPEVLYAGALKGLMESLEDPYTSYLNSSQMRSLNDTTIGNFGGVGLTITKPQVSTPEKPAYVEVTSPIEGGPGYKAGIHAGDLILSINGTPTPDISMNEVLGILRGTVGEGVNVVIRRGKKMEFSRTLIRENIEVPTVKFGMIENMQKKIGYIRIIEFTPQTAERVQEAFDTFTQNKFESLIIDLRNNPGGLITSVAEVADKFIDNGIIVSTKSRKQETENVFTASPEKTTMPKGIPIIVLINKGSASASEILSGALKDYKLAYLMGERSYGKGSVQQVINLYNNDGVKLTMARYYTPSDVNIDKIGIPPDREVKMEVLEEDEEKAYVDLMNSNEIAKYVEVHENMTKNDVFLYAKDLSKKYSLKEKLLRRLINMELNRTKDPLLYDLDYDDQLVAAIKLIETEDFNKLMKFTKTLKQLQDEAKLKEEKSDDKKNK